MNTEDLSDKRVAYLLDSILTKSKDEHKENISGILSLTMRDKSEYEKLKILIDFLIKTDKPKNTTE